MVIPRPLRPLLPAFVALLLMSRAALAEADLTLETMVWGIEGRVASLAFNPVRLTIRNDGDEPYDGVVTVEPAGLVQSSIEYQTDLYLRPGETRQVRLTMFVPLGGGEWQLRSAGPGGRDTVAPLDPLVVDDPVIVHLTSDARSIGLPRLPPADLPAKSTAMEVIKALVLTDSPRLQPVQQRAMLDWVAAGGVVVLAPGSSGQLPDLPGSLQSLDAAGGTRRIGLGDVIVLDEPPDRTSVEDAIDSGRRQYFSAIVDGVPVDAFGGIVSQTGRLPFESDGLIVGSLQSIVESSTFAAFFLPLSLAYVVVLGLLSRQARLDRWSPLRFTLALGGLTGAASIVLVAASPLSSSSRAASVTVCIAKPLGDGRAVVWQWEMRRERLPGTVEQLPRAESQVAHAEGRAVRVAVRDGASQTLGLTFAPITTATLRARGIVTLTDPESIAATAVNVTRDTETAEPVQVVRPPGSTDDYPLALRLEGDDYQLMLPAKPSARMTLGKKPPELRSDWADQLADPTVAVSGSIFGKVWTLTRPPEVSRYQSILAGWVKDERSPREQLLRTMSATVTADRRVTGTFHFGELPRPEGRSRLVLAGPLRPDVDLLGDGVDPDTRTGLVWWLLDEGGGPVPSD